MGRKITVVVLLLLASVHCARSIFYQNCNFQSFEKLEAGTEDLPYQSRCLLIPLLRWAHTNRTLNRAADTANRRSIWMPGRSLVPELETPEKIFSTILGVLCVIGLGAVASFASKHQGLRLWWLPWILILETLFTGYAARTRQNLWNFYDLPAYFLFGLGTFFVLRKQYLPLLFLMPFAAANRETAIFLCVLWLAATWEDARWKGVLQALGLAAAWFPVRFVIWQRFRHNPTVVANRMHSNFNIITQSPQSWPQVASAFGFLLPILLLYRSSLSTPSKRMLWGMLICVAVVLYFGIWVETRIFGEFYLLFALLLTEVVEARLLPPLNRVQAAPTQTEESWA